MLVYCIIDDLFYISFFQKKSFLMLALQIFNWNTDIIAIKCYLFIYYRSSLHNLQHVYF